MFRSKERRIEAIKTEEREREHWLSCVLRVIPLIRTVSSIWCQWLKCWKLGTFLIKIHRYVHAYVCVHTHTCGRFNISPTKKSLKKHLLSFGTVYGQHLMDYFHFFHVRKEKLEDFKNIHIIHLHHVL